MDDITKAVVLSIYAECSSRIETMATTTVGISDAYRIDAIKRTLEEQNARIAAATHGGLMSA